MATSKSKTRLTREQFEAQTHAEDTSETGTVGELEMAEGWESVPEAFEAIEEETGTLPEFEGAEDIADHGEVSSDGSAATEVGDIEAAGYGEAGAPTETEQETLSELEAVPGFDPSLLEATPETLAETGGDERLLDAWYADMGDPALGAMLRRPGVAESIAEVVIGADDRIRITATKSYPWRCICSLLITARDNSRWIGTGWLIGNRTVVTAGHCVYMHSRGGWARAIEVIPGRNGAQRPFGSATSSNLRSVKGWTQKKKRSHDYGAIILPQSNPYGKKLGYFGFANYSFFTLLGMKVNLSGYPGDKPAGTQWWHARRIKAVTSRRLIYNIDTAGGQSGSPVWRKKGSSRYGVGIHTNGSSLGNSATRITKPVFSNLKKWKQQGS